MNHASLSVYTSTENRVKTVLPQPKQQSSYTLLPRILPMNTQALNKPTLYAINLAGSPSQTVFSPTSMPLQNTVLLQVLPSPSLRYIVTQGQVQSKSHENNSNDAKPQVLKKTPLNSKSVSSSAISTAFIPATKNLPPSLVSIKRGESKITNIFNPRTKNLHSNSVSNENSDSKKGSTLSFDIAKSTDNINPKISKKRINNLSCFLCNITCGSIELLQQHKEGVEFYCRVCAQRFDDHAELESHSRNHKTYLCKVCKTQFYTHNDRLQHKRANVKCSKQVECGICIKWFINKRSLAAHRRTFHRDKIRRSVECFKCNICSRAYDTRYRLAAHSEDMHNAYEDMECQTCQKIVRGPKRMKQHVQSLHFTSITEDINSLTCQICKKIFIKAANLASHLRTHDETEKLCEICGKSVKQRLMRSHMHIEHPKTGIFKCKNCNEQFDTYHKMKNHAKKHFTKPDPVYCEICGKKYTTDTVLRKHYAIHSEEKPFKCDTCGASFKQKVALNTHQRVHSTVGKYKCNGCGMTFKWQQTFGKHTKKCELIQEDNIVDDDFSST